MGFVGACRDLLASRPARTSSDELDWSVKAIVPSKPPIGYSGSRRTFGRPAERADSMASCRKPQRSNQRQRTAADGVSALVTGYSQHKESAVDRADAQHVCLGRRPLHRGSIQPRFAANVQSHAFPIAVEWHGGNMRIHAKPSLARSADMFLPTLASKASAECGAPSCVLPCRWYATAAFRPT